MMSEPGLKRCNCARAEAALPSTTSRAASMALRRCFGVLVPTIVKAPLAACRTPARGLVAGSEMQTHRHRVAFRSGKLFRATDMRAHARSRRYSLRGSDLLGRGRCAGLA